jgi:starch synthase
MPSEEADHPLHIVMVSSEAVPFSKTGGLADVVGALAPELAKLGHDVHLIIPRHRLTEARTFSFEEFARLTVPTVMGEIETVVELVKNGSGRGTRGKLTILTLRCDRYFDRAGLYQEAGRDYQDNLERFSFFCRAAMEILLILVRQNSWISAVLHLHDWQAALCAVYLKTLYASYTELRRVRSVLTLHNLGYQGIFPAGEFPKTGLPNALFATPSLEYYGSVNLLKGGIVFADLLTTVSPTYSQEIQTAEYGLGLEGVLAEKKEILHGILNGIDIDTWNPATDRYLSSHYSATELAGKGICKIHLQREFQLRQGGTLLIGIIARLTAQKGIDLVLDIIPDLMEMEVQLVILGAGDEDYVNRLDPIVRQYSGRIGFREGFDEGLAHRIEAGADLLLMPSRYEPCGLSQMYSLRYGTVPVVRKTGGLADTVVPCTPRNIQKQRATGFVFTDAAPESLLNAVMLASMFYERRSNWQVIMQAGMNTDNSWKRSATAYADLFTHLARHQDFEMSEKLKDR